MEKFDIKKVKVHRTASGTIFEMAFIRLAAVLEAITATVCQLDGLEVSPLVNVISLLPMSIEDSVALRVAVPLSIGM